jgi:hypothetical protein
MIVLGHLSVNGIGDRIIPVGFFNAAFGIVQDKSEWSNAEIIERTNV